MKNKRYQLIANICILAFVGLTLFIPLLRTDIGPINNTISDYLVGSYGGLTTLSFLILAAAGLIKAYLSQDKVIATILIAYSLGIVLAAFTHPGDPLHSIGAWTAFSTIPLTMVLTYSKTKKAWILPLLVLTIASFFTWGVLGVGLGERMSVFLELAWLALLPDTKPLK